MQKFLLGPVAAFAVCAAGAAMVQPARAQPPGGVDFSAHASLATPTTAPREALINGVKWRCEGTECRGIAERNANVDNVVRECKRVVAVVGPVTSYWSRARVLTDGQLKACNRASDVQTAQK